MYLVIEGIDGSGKDTQAALLAKSMPGYNYVVNEPDDSLPTGKLLRQLLKEGDYPQCHAALFLADRLALQESKVQYGLDKGWNIISVRNFLSTLVYQQDQWPLDWLWDLHRTLPVKPTHIVLLDLPAEEAIKRVSGRGGQKEFYERLDKLQVNRQRYLDLLPQMTPHMVDGGRVMVADAQLTERQLNESIMAWINEETV